MAKITEFEQVMMERDHMTRKEACDEKNRMREELYDILENGGGYDDVEDLLLDDCGLEMDYLFDLL